VGEREPPGVRSRSRPPPSDPRDPARGCGRVRGLSRGRTPGRWMEGDQGWSDRALVRSPFHQSGRLQLAPITACRDADIGTNDSATRGLPATPFSIDGIPNCDPYSSACELVYVSADRYAALGGVSPSNVDFGSDLVVCIQDWLTRVDCSGHPGGTFIVALRMPPSDALGFRESYSCGGSVAELCA
jgi:hypothetical protein